MPCDFTAILVKYRDGKEKVRTVWYGAVSGKLPGRNERLFMAVVKGFGEEPTMLLINWRSNLRVKESILGIVEICLSRWKCNESFR